MQSSTTLQSVRSSCRPRVVYISDTITGVIGSRVEHLSIAALQMVRWSHGRCGLSWIGEGFTQCVFSKR